MPRLLLPFPDMRAFADALAPSLGARVGALDWHRFPDGESLVTLDPHVRGADVAVVATLNRPDELALALRFAGQTARELGARSVGLVAPYLAYMRQDRRFTDGQALTAPLFAAFVEDAYDWLVTVDPHLHRYGSLDAVYRKPATRVASAPAVAAWLRDHAAGCALVGPDSESAQWVRDVAERVGAPWQVLEKTRRGDRDVSVSVPDAGPLRGRPVVVLDDIASSGRTFAEALRALAAAGIRDATCVAIHAVFAGDALDVLRAAGAARIVSTDTILHETNAISVVALVADAVAVRM